MNRKEFFIAIFGGSIAAVSTKKTEAGLPFSVAPNMVLELEKGTYSVNQVRAFYGLEPLPAGDAYTLELFAKHRAL